jgi:hypothetical protein
MKWLAAALSLVVAALLVLLWLQMHDSEPTVVPSTQAQQPTTVTPVVTVASAEKSQIADAVAKVQAANDASKKIDINSDAFFIRFDDLIPQMLTRNAAKCYTGGLHRVHRNQKVKLSFKDHIVDGKVTVSDVKVVAGETTINDPDLVKCFVEQVSATTWTDNELPDWTQDDELVIRPERGMKKFTKDNMEYETDTPDFTNR